MATVGRMKRGVPEGLWIRCPQCKATIFRKEAESRFNVCPECDYHFYVAAPERIRQLLAQRRLRADLRWVDNGVDPRREAESVSKGYNRML